MIMAKQRISRIVEKWFVIEPLFFAIWTTHEQVSHAHIKSIRVGRGRIEYNPSFIKTLDGKTLYSVLVFEVMRILLKHPYARKKENPHVAYTASNITIQEYLRTPLDFPYARQVFHTNEYDKKHFEFYYDKLLEQANQTDGQGPDDEEGKLLEQTNQTDGQGPDSELLEQTDQTDGQGPDSEGVENTEYWDDDPFFTHAIHDKIEAAQHNHAWGSVPGQLRVWILANLKPKVNYRQILKAFRARILSVNRSLTRMKPSRRYDFQYMGSRRDFCTKLLFAVDVSGSIHHYDLMNGFSVINRMFKYGIERVDVIQFDTEIKGKTLALKKASHKVEITGRGGTNFQPLMDFIDCNKNYDGLVVFTDGWAATPTPPKNRKTKIVWLFNNEDNYHRMKTALQEMGRVTYVKEA